MPTTAIEHPRPHTRALVVGITAALVGSTIAVAPATAADQPAPESATTAPAPALPDAEGRAAPENVEPETTVEAGLQDEAQPQATTEARTATSTTTTSTSATTKAEVEAAPVTPKTTLSASKRKITRGEGSSRPRFAVTATTPDGKAVKGTARLVVNGKTVSTKKLSARGAADFRPGWAGAGYKPGSNSVRVRIVPAKGTAVEARTTRTVTVNATAKARTSFSASKRTVRQGEGSSRPTYTVRARDLDGTALRGKARLVVNGKTVSTKKLNARGAAQFTPGWGKAYSNGRNSVRVVVLPAPRTHLQNTSTRTIQVTGKRVDKGREIVRVANQYVGHRYTHGGSSPRTGFDCSGFTSYVVKKATGKTLSRTSSAQRNQGRTVSRSNARAGDIVWTPGHVAIYAGNGRVIESARPGVGVVSRSMWQRNPVFVRVT